MEAIGRSEMSIMAFSVDSIYWNRTLHLVFLKALPSQIIDHSNFAAQHDLALDDEVEYKSCRHQLRQILNGLWINRRKQHEYHALSRCVTTNGVAFSRETRSTLRAMRR